MSDAGQVAAVVTNAARRGAATILPIAAVIPTADRARSLERCFRSILAQDVALGDIVVVDASIDGRVASMCEDWFDKLGTGTWIRASAASAAGQRNAALPLVDQPFVLFLDDDVELKPRCVSALWHAIRSDERIGGVNAMIENQRSVAPGLFSRALFRVAGGDGRPAAGRCLGPALNVLPADDPELPAIVTVEWLNTTCTLYRRAALPSPLFPAHFTGYSFGEDLDLSLRVGRSWRLVNAHDARVVHHSESGTRDPAAAAEMALVNRHYIMTSTLGRTSALDHARLAAVEFLLVVSTLTRPRGWRQLPAVMRGKLRAIVRILRKGGG